MAKRAPTTKVFIVHLRRPTKKPDEMRSDPFWEHGSFGCTRCHSRNLLHPRNAGEVDGARLAFAQGGPLGFKLVLLTPPVKVRAAHDHCEVVWKAARMPFKYHTAPVLAANGSKGDFPLLERLASSTNRTTIEGGFSSRFRSCVTPLEPKIAAQLVKVYEHKRRSANKSMFCRSYEEALPFSPPLIDRNRKATLDRLRRRSGRSTACAITRKC